MLNSGVHATITGVLVAFAIPFEKGERKSISYKLEKALHIPVAFAILPLFALANTAILLNFSSDSFFTSTYSLGIILGLIVGKPLGIFLFSFAAVKMKISKLAEDLTLKVVLGAGMLGGIGFTMSIFIALLAFDSAEVINTAKVAIIAGSIFSGTLGYLYLRTYFSSKDSTAF
jgi:NhaA family Na+:H+ antiporter